MLVGINDSGTVNRYAPDSGGLSPSVEGNAYKTKHIYNSSDVGYYL